LQVSNDGFREIGKRLAELSTPTVLIQEGGYDLSTLGPDVMAVLEAFH
jgi:acetoin utilization deacetylase AcuC-like enzyme